MIIRLNGWKVVGGPQDYNKYGSYSENHKRDIERFYQLRECEIFLTTIEIKNKNGPGSYKRIRFVYIPIESRCKNTFKQWQSDKIMKNLNYKYIKSNYFIKQSRDRDLAYVTTDSRDEI